MIRNSLLNSTIVFLTLLFISTVHCKVEEKSKEFVLRIRIQDEPDCLHPVVSESGLATPIEVLIMPPLFEYHPTDLKFSPILVKEMVEPKLLNDSTITYTYSLQENAVWDDGSPLTSKDIIYTIKSSLNPCLRNKTYSGFFKKIRDVIPDSLDPKKIVFHIARNYMQAQEMSGNYCIYPEHIYDSSYVLRNIPLNKLLNAKDSTEYTSGEWNVLKNYAAEYQSKNYCRDKIVGTGPYRLVAWESGRRIILEKKKNWWGDSLAKVYPLLTANPDRIEYIILPDEATSILELKKGNVDIVSDLSPNVFVELQKTEKDHLQFAMPMLMQYNYIEINHRNPILQNLNVRKALAHLIDVDQFIKNEYDNLAIRVNSPVHPNLTYYNKNLHSFDYQPTKALDLLKNDGWTDSDNNGILDKNIDGKRTELSLKFYVLNKEASKKLGLILQEEARKIGMRIELVPKEASTIMKDLKELNFDLVLLSQRHSPSLWDPYQNYSSTNVQAGSFNKSGYSNVRSDSLIWAIRNAGDTETRNRFYLEFQQLIHDDVSQIFLFTPNERICYSNQIKFDASSRRPGYYEGMISRK